MFLVNFQHVACPQRACAWRSAFLTNAFLFRALMRLARNKNERIPSAASGDERSGNRRDSGDDGDETGEDHEASVEAGGTHSKSGARRTGQPRPGAPGSRPRIGNAADLLPFFTTYALRLTSFFFFAAKRHYPRNPAQGKRLRVQLACYTKHSATVFPNAYDARGSAR
ncbi:hypothetical protein [Burkholderia lata]|uniref:hypothetical protein n=1 Tax=Burkholderia lata (strain ATCC 17760 / DSM 23089 / LMG 22485 / NCIMB 9086 / R18194 / 383) TaxID=482957 RepID=UPI001583AD43|nr:hypothetical protein [Burkholderia lata]